MTKNELESIRKSEIIYKIEYISNHSHGVMFIKEVLFLKIAKKFHKAFKDCTYNISLATSDEMLDQMSKIRDRGWRYWKWKE